MAQSLLDLQLELSTLALHVCAGNPLLSGIPVLTRKIEILFSDDLFSAYKKAIPGVRFDSKSGLLEIPKSSISKMRPLAFDIGGNYFTLDVGAQLVPADENSAWGGERSKRYGVVGLLPDVASGNGVDFILGIAFMERFYTVRVGTKIYIYISLMELLDYRSLMLRTRGWALRTRELFTAFFEAYLKRRLCG